MKRKASRSLETLSVVPAAKKKGDNDKLPDWPGYFVSVSYQNNPLSTY